MISRIYDVSSTLQGALVCILVSLLHGQLSRVQKICFRAFCSSSFWCICYSARLSRPEYSYSSLLFCHGLSFTALVHGVGSGSKLPLAFSALQLVHQRSKISSRGQHFLGMILCGGSHNWVQMGCDPCWHSWHCCRKIRPLVVALLNHLALNWQMLGITSPLCCFVTPSSHPFGVGRF